jgi:hypothetical protein
VSRPVDLDALAGVLHVIDTEGLPAHELHVAHRTVTVTVETDAQVEDWSRLPGFDDARVGAGGLRGWVEVTTAGVVGHAHVRVRLQRQAEPDEYAVAGTPPSTFFARLAAAGAR